MLVTDRSLLDLPLSELDPEVTVAVGKELHRQQSTREMIASGSLSG